MTIQRIRQYPQPPQNESGVRDYLKRLHYALTQESTERIQDFENLNIANITIADIKLSSMTNKSVPFINSSLKLDEDNTNLSWNDSTNQLSVNDIIAKGPIVDVRAYTSFSNAISTIGATETTLLIPNQQDVTTDETVPATMTLSVARGGSLNISAARTVTINGQIMAGLYQIFEGSGSVAIGDGSVNKVYPEWWGAKSDGSTDSTSAISATISSLPSNGGKILFSIGAYLFDDVELPAYPKVIDIKGAGIRATIFQPYSTNTRLFDFNSSVAERNIIGNFSIKAHASGSTGEAIDLNHTRATIWYDIEFLTNGSGDFAKGFKFISNNMCYSNQFDHIIVAEQTGPTTLFSFENAGDSTTNGNVHFFRNLWIYANASGLTTVFDGAKSALVIVEDSLFESNSAATIFKPGTNWIVQRNWLESNSAYVTPQTVAANGGATNNFKFLNNYLGSTFTITIDSTLQDWLVSGNAGAALTVTDNGTNNLIQLGKTFSNIYTDGTIGINTTPSTGIDLHNKGASEFEAGGADGSLGLQHYYALTAYPDTYRHKIETSHSATAASNKMAFSVCDGNSGGFVSIIDLRGNGSLYYNDSGTLKQVTFGANDSGGAGYKLLRVTN